MRYINFSESKSYFEFVQSHWPSEKFEVKLGLHAQEFIQVFALLFEDSSNVYLCINSQFETEQSNNKKAVLPTIQTIDKWRFSKIRKADDEIELGGYSEFTLESKFLKF